MKNLLSPSLLTWLRCFDAVARNGSFTIAAKELHVTQGSISQQVKKLEEYLGITLLHRGGKALSLTREGARLSLVSGQAFQSLNQAVDKLRQSHPRKDAPLNLSCSPSFAMLWLTPRVGDLLREQSGMSVRIYGEFHSLDRVGMSVSGIQVGIRFDPGHYSDLHADRFLDELLVPVASPDFLKRYPGIHSVNDIPTDSMLHDASAWHNAPPTVEWDTWLEGMGGTPPKHSGVHFNLSQLAIIAALSGQGIAMGRLALVYDELVSGRLVVPVAFAVPSKAHYHFIFTNEPTGTNAHLRDWLHSAGEQFTADRDDLLERLGVQTQTLTR
ncbi:LysR family transcriptional regulator [Diaphorobacter sp. HDW4A]|uniref:LysR family transcriptional regulator n=1 Tax=Diaphorobacter sp. HDW4A TaxID=2714924 RepID=UPI00140CF80D|nr:LysR family transcriptional regulator [Diaphorobacter sp. HDW4A]QIL80742.1 LysR family transcriptional regulator [Diaphorobacter sp. HDW4A]